MTSGNSRTRYESVADSLRARIVSGEWRIGEPLPAKRALAAEMDVALATLDKAVAALRDEGLLEIKHGRGTFVLSLTPRPRRSMEDRMAALEADHAEMRAWQDAHERGHGA